MKKGLDREIRLYCIPVARKSMTNQRDQQKTILNEMLSQEKLVENINIVGAQKDTSLLIDPL